MANELVNNVIVDFTKEIGVVMPKKVIYTSGDINTSYIHITCNNNGIPMDLSGYNVSINVARIDGTSLNSNVSIVNAVKGEIKALLTTSMLCVGLNYMEVMLSLGDKQLVSPMIPYKVVTSISSDMDENIPNTNEHPILIQLIEEVKSLPEKLNRELTPIVIDKINIMDNKVGEVDDFLKSSNDKELIREKNEVTRQDNEVVRNSQELERQNSISSMENRFNAKLVQVDNKISETTNVTNENIKKIDVKIVDCENRMQSIEDVFDGLVNGTGYATVQYVDSKVDKIETQLSVVWETVEG